MNRIQSNTLKLVAAMAGDMAVTMIYRDRDGVVSMRTVQPLKIEKCANGQIVVRCYDVNRDAPRCFRLADVRHIDPLAVVAVG